jgi:hypothetical protein
MVRVTEAVHAGFKEVLSTMLNSYRLAVARKAALPQDADEAEKACAQLQLDLEALATELSRQTPGTEAAAAFDALRASVQSMTDELLREVGKK